MKAKTLLLPFLGAVLLMAADVKVDFNHSADFNTYKTYSWIKVDAGDPLWQDRIQNAIEMQLTAKGLTKVPSGGDLAVAAVGSTKTERQLQTVYNDFGGGWFWRGFDGTATTYEDKIPVGNLMLDLFDSHSKKLVWRGTASRTLSDKPEKNEKKLREDVAEMFKDFPPKSKG